MMNCAGSDVDSHSVSSSRPSAAGSNPKMKKRGLRRFSIRQFFYASPLMAPHRRFSRNKSVPEVDSRSESSLSTQTTGERNASGAKSRGNVGRNDSVRSKVTTGAAAGAATSLSSDAESNSNVSSQSLLKCTTNPVPTKEGEDDSECSHLIECPLCLGELTLDCFPKLSSCSHRSCLDCLQQYLRIEIVESRVNICCPECTEPIHPTDIRAILNDVNIMNKYEDFMLRRVLATDPDTRWCPAPDCSFAVVATGCASCPRLQCERPGCQTFFCYHCKQEWHPNQTCDAARAQRSPNIRASSISFGQDSTQRDDIKPCPRCQVLIVKMDDGSCNHMTCAICGAEFCWLCMKEISDLHYLSPSGCTFWGKKPWSRKKKILWQLGTLVGAPVGIGLVAGIAVPAIIIGVPVWVGRKLHARYEHASKHKRNLAITGGVTASILISPVLASLAVGIGVPILLAYVYGVVPISLCRSGGCGVSTSGAGVRIDFDDENEMSTVGGGQTHDAQSVDTSSHRVGNPSIGEVSFGMSASLSMGSGSHLDRIGVIRDSDRESASNTAIASTSLTGSMSSGMVLGATGHRLEVQADVSSDKRFSFSSETASATVSLSERSTTMSLADDASTKALAGSIIGSRDPSTSFTPVEVHVDATMSPVGSSQDSFNTTAKGNDPTISDCAQDDGCAGRSTSFRGKQRVTSADRQITSTMESESCSLWSREDTSSERVRFDENVNFIDDLPSDDFQFATCSGTSGSAPSDVSAESWHNGGSKRKPSYEASDNGSKSTSRKHSLTWLLDGAPGSGVGGGVSADKRTSSVSTWHGPVSESGGFDSEEGDVDNVTFSPLYSKYSEMMMSQSCSEYGEVFSAFQQTASDLRTQSAASKPSFTSQEKKSGTR